jgi:hypothetical protein
MSELETLRKHALERARWEPASGLRAACLEHTSFGTPKPADHANCGGHRCGCYCHRPTDKERKMWRQIADEITAYLAPGEEGHARLFEVDA